MFLVDDRAVEDRGVNPGGIAGGRRLGEHIRRKDDDVGELAGLERAFARLIE